MIYNISNNVNLILTDMFNEILSMILTFLRSLYGLNGEKSLISLNEGLLSLQKNVGDKNLFYKNLLDVLMKQGKKF